MKSVIISRALQALGRRARVAGILAAVAFAALFMSACDDSSGPRRVTTLTVSPTSATVPVNGTQQFTAVAMDQDGNVLDVTPSWSIGSPGGGTISSTGLFTAGNLAGTYTNTVVVTCSGLTATATVIVASGPLASITVTPDPVTLGTGAQQQFVAAGRDAFNNLVVITPVWSVANGGGTIDASTGLFTAGTNAGTFANTVVATSGTLSDAATVTVTAGALLTITVKPNPATVQINTNKQFTAVGRDANGNVVPITPVWTVTNGGGTINASTGLFTAGGSAGTFPNTVRATDQGKFGRATVIVTLTPPPPDPAPIVDLGDAEPMGIMAGTTITCVTGGIINADIAISPGSTITGFGPCVVTGDQHLADPVAAQAQRDLTQAYNTLFGLPCPPANNVGTVNIGGTTKAAGVYCSASSMQVTGTLTLDGGGDVNSTFVFQAGSTITTAGDVVLINGAQARNVYFVAGSSVTLGVGSQWQGNVIALSSITLNDNVTLLGRALARNGAVTLGNNNVITLP
jgi:ice-binding like protein